MGLGGYVCGGRASTLQLCRESALVKGPSKEMA